MSPGGVEFVETEALEANLEELPAPVRPSRRLPVATALLALCAVGCIGFAVGVAIEKGQLPKTTAATGGGGGAGAAGGGGATGNRAGATATTAADGTGRVAGGAGALGGQGAVVGQVQSVNGATIVLVDSTGNTVRVTATDTAQVTKSASVGDIKPGDYLTVMGTTAADGSTQAVRIVDNGSTPPAAGAGAGRAGAGATGTTVAGATGSTAPTGSAPPGSGRPGGTRPGGGPTTTAAP